MIHKNEQQIHTQLQRISNILLINGGYLANPGLYSGEMGLVLFFYHYARLTQNEIYAEYGSGLLQKIQNKIHPNTPVNYKQGLSGIGSAIEYLTQNGFLNINTDVALEEFDKRIFFTFNLPYLSIDKITDIGYYALWRLSGSSVQKDMILKSVMPQIIHVMEEWQMNQPTINPTVFFFKDLVMKKKHHFWHDRSMLFNWLQLCCKHNSNNLDDAKPFTQLLECFSTHSSTTDNALDLGFQHGLAGLGLFLISKLGCDDSWFSLFPNDIIPCEK